MAPGLTRRTLGLLAAASAVATPAFAQMPGAPPPDPAALLPHENLAEALELLTRRRWRPLMDLLRALPPQSAHALMGDLGEATEIDVNVSGLRDLSMGPTLIGSLQVDWGWRYRGHSFGSDVPEAAMLEFWTRLNLAKAQLERALATDPDDGVAAAVLIRTQKGLQDVAAIHAAFETFMRAGRKPVTGYADYADAIAAKWYGSNEQMTNFAREHAESLPPASHALVAQAHTETMFQWARDPRVGDNAPAFLMSEAVQTELQAANTAFQAASNAQDRYAALYAHAHFSYVFVMSNQPDLARPHVEAMGHQVSGPWARFDNPRAVVGEIRTLLGLGATPDPL